MWRAFGSTLFVQNRGAGAVFRTIPSESVDDGGAGDGADCFETSPCYREG